MNNVHSKRVDKRAGDFNYFDTQKKIKIDEPGPSKLCSTSEITEINAKNAVLTRINANTVSLVQNFNLSNKKENGQPITFDLIDPISSFYGRDDEIKQLEEYFRAENSNIQFKIAAVCGLAGIGKSELARYYAHKNFEYYGENLIWIKAETTEKLIESFKGVAQEMELENVEKFAATSIVQRTYSFFKNKKVLFIFDNVENHQKIFDYMPSKLSHKNIKINILITSQYDIWDDSVHVVKLNILSESAALAIFKDIVKEEIFSKIGNENDWLKLAETFDFIPLGLQVAATFIKEMDFQESVLDYIKYFHENSDILEEELQVLPYEKSIFAALRYTLKKIENNKTRAVKCAVQTINICSFLDADRIFYKYFLNLEFINENKIFLDRIFTVLKQYAFITRVVDRKWDKQILIHRLVQRFFRYFQEQNKITEYYKTTLLRCNSIYTVKYTIHMEQLLQSLENKQVTTFINNNKLLLHACKIHAFNTIQLLLKFKLDVNAKSSFDRTPLVQLLERECENEIETISTVKYTKQFLDMGADANSVYGADSSSLLHWAAQYLQFEFIQLLVEKYNLNVNAENVLKETPLHYLCKSEKFDNAIQNSVDTLVTLGAQINCEKHFGGTVLHFVIRNNNLQFFQYLLSKVSNDQETNTIQCKINKIVLRHRYIHITNEEGEIIVFDVFKENLSQSEYLMMYASVYGSVDIIQFLITETNIDIYQSFFNGNTLLHILSWHDKNLPLLQKYLSDGLDANTKNNSGETLLLCAVKYNSYETVKYLCNAHGMNIFCTDNNNNTLLHIAAENYHKELISMFLSSKLNINAKNHTGQTPLHLAMKYNVEDEPEDAIDIFDLLISHGANIYIKDNEGHNVLQYAVLKSNEIAIRYLIKNCGMDVNICDNDKRTLLHLAVLTVMQSHQDLNVIPESIISSLFSLGASKDIEDKNGKTASQLAKYFENENKVNTDNSVEADIIQENLKSCTFIVYSVEINSREQLMERIMEAINKIRYNVDTICVYYSLIRQCYTCVQIKILERQHRWSEDEDTSD